MLTLDRRYELEDADARARLRALTDYWSTKHGLRVEWRTDSDVHVSGKVMRVSFEGTVRVGDGRIHAEVDAGWIAEKLGARGYVEKKLEDYLSPANSLADLRARIPTK